MILAYHLPTFLTKFTKFYVFFKSSLNDISEDEMSKSIRKSPEIPTVATYNLRSLFPKINNLKDDIVERGVDCAFLSEIWEHSENETHQYELDKLLQLHGLQYFS